MVVPDNVLFEGGAGERSGAAYSKTAMCIRSYGCRPASSMQVGSRPMSCSSTRSGARPERPWTNKLWVYDFRTGEHFTLRQRKLSRQHLDEFVKAYRPGEPRENREESERFKCFTYDELIARDKANLDIKWLRDPDLEDGDNLQPPEIIAQEIVEDLQAALNEFAAVAEALQLAKAEREGNVVDE